MENQIHIPLDAALHARVREACLQRHTSEEELMRRALEEFLARDEDMRLMLAEDEARWQEYLRTGEHVTMDEVSAWIDGEIAELSKQIASS